MSTNQQNIPGPAIGAITSMVERRDRALKLVLEAIGMIDDAMKIAPDFAFQSSLRSFSWYNDHGFERDKEKVRKNLDIKCWNELLETTKLGAAMNSEQLEGIRKQIGKESPALTAELAQCTFMELFVKRKDTFRKGLVDVFEGLHGRFRSHSPFKVDKRIILAECLSDNGWAAFGHHRDRFDDLWNYASLLDGVDPTDVKYSDRPSSIVASKRQSGIHDIEFDQFRVKAFKNGNLHIYLREDLIEKINATIAEYYGENLADDRGR